MPPKFCISQEIMFFSPKLSPSSVVHFHLEKSDFQYHLQTCSLGVVICFFIFKLKTLQVNSYISTDYIEQQAFYLRGHPD